MNSDGLKIKTLFIVLFVLMSFTNFVPVYAANYFETDSYNIGFAGGDLAKDASGNIYIADANNYQVRKYTNLGVFILQFGGIGTGNGKFSDVMGVAVDADGDVFVVDINRVQKFNSSGVYQSQFAVSGSPIGIAIDSNDDIYVVRSASGIVSKYTNAGVFVYSFGSIGAGNGQFTSPSNINIDANGKRYISDDGNKRVEVFDSTNAFLFQITGFGNVNPAFLMPVDIDTDSVGNIYVADTDNNMVKVYNDAGQFLSSFDVTGNPFGLIVETNVLLVSSAGDTILRRFTLDDVVPAVTITPFASNATSIGLPYILGNATDTISPVSAVQFSLNSNPGVWHPCSAVDSTFNEVSEDFSCTPTSNLAPGIYEITIRATDSVANTSSGDTYSFTVVDDAPPIISNTALAGDQTYDTTPSLTGSVTDAVTAVTSLEYEMTETAPDVWNACTSDDGTFDELSEIYTCAIATPLSIGSRTIRIRSTDSAAHTNDNGTIVTYVFTVNALTTPTVTTGSSSVITTTSATVTGNVSANGGSVVLEKGIVYSSVATVPTIADSKSIAAMGIGAISQSLTGLTPATLYYARAYAINAQGTAYGSVIQFTTSTPVTPTPTPTTPASLVSVYVTFAKFRYGKYVSPTALRVGDTAYIKNFNTSKLTLLQVFLYDYAKKGNQGFAKSKVTTTSMFLRTTSLLPTGKRYAYVFKFQDKATGIIATKYFVVYTAKTWLGHSVLGATTTNLIGENETLAEAITPTTTPTEGSDAVDNADRAPVSPSDLPTVTSSPQVENPSMDKMYIAVVAVIVGSFGLLRFFSKRTE